MFNSSYQQIDILLTKDDIHTLVNIVIANPTWAYLLPRSWATQRFVTLNTTQAKERSYCDQHTIDQFLFLGIDVFGHLHKQVDIFYMIVPMPFRTWKGQRAFISCFCYFLSSKKFNHIAKDANLFHSKSSHNRRLNYFLAPTPSKHTSLHHGWHIVGDWFLTWTNTTYYNVQFLTWRHFDI
jgi:hypothetical protein